MVAPDARLTFDTMADGANASIANINAATGSGTPPDAVSGATRSSVDPSAAVRGAKGVIWSHTAANGYFTWNAPASTVTASMQFGFIVPVGWTLPTVTADYLNFRNFDDSATISKINLTTAGVWNIVHGGNGTAYTLNSGAALPAGSYWFWMGVTRGTTTTNGQIEFTLRNATTNALIENYSNTSANVTNAGTTSDIGAIRLGRQTSSGNASYMVDEIGWKWGSIAEIDTPVSTAFTIKKFVRIG